MFTAFASPLTILSLLLFATFFVTSLLIGHRNNLDLFTLLHKRLSVRKVDLDGVFDAVRFARGRDKLETGGNFLVRNLKCELVFVLASRNFFPSKFEKALIKFEN